MLNWPPVESLCHNGLPARQAGRQATPCTLPLHALGKCILVAKLQRIRHCGIARMLQPKKVPDLMPKSVESELLCVDPHQLAACSRSVGGAVSKVDGWAASGGSRLPRKQPRRKVDPALIVSWVVRWPITIGGSLRACGVGNARLGRRGTVSAHGQAAGVHGPCTESTPV